MHDELVAVARTLAGGHPSQAALRRAVSTAYYALFHAFSHDAATLLAGAQKSDTWQRVYRSLDHKLAKEACLLIRPPAFSADIKRCAERFVALQKKRHDADYDPIIRFHPAGVLADIASAEFALANYFRCAEVERRAFAAHLLFKPRK